LSFTPILISIVKHVDADVNIGSLFLNSIEYARRRMAATRNRATYPLLFELSQNDIHQWQGGQGAEVQILIRARGTCDWCREVVNLLQIVVGAQ